MFQLKQVEHFHLLKTVPLELAIAFILGFSPVLLFTCNSSQQVYKKFRKAWNTATLSLYSDTFFVIFSSTMSMAGTDVESNGVLLHDLPGGSTENNQVVGKSSTVLSPVACSECACVFVYVHVCV